MTSPDVEIKKANRRSAVERLEESKANYVKTEHVLDCKQEFEHSSTVHVSTRPRIDILLRAPVKNFYNVPNTDPNAHNINYSENVNDTSVVKRNTYRSRNIFETKSKSPARDTQLTNKKFCSRNYDYGEVRGSETATAAWKVSMFSNMSDDMMTKSPITCQNDFLPENTTPFGTRHWESSRDKCWDSEYLSNRDESEGEEPSTDGTRDSISTGDTMEFDDRCHDSKTSDYVSRSSSFKCLVASERVRNLVNRFESHFNKNNDSTSTEIENKGKSVSRSKSDISHRFSKGFSVAQEKKATNDVDLERFFNTMGLETSAWKSIASPPRSPAHFFASVSSVDSEDCLSSVCSEDSSGEMSKEKGLKNQDVRRHAPNETSIIEKNARVVKWLYNCYNSKKVPNS